MNVKDMIKFLETAKEEYGEDIEVLIHYSDENNPYARTERTLPVIGVSASSEMNNASGGVPVRKITIHTRYRNEKEV